MLKFWKTRHHLLNQNMNYNLEFSSYDICEDFGSSSWNLARLDLTEQKQVCVDLELTG